MVLAGITVGMLYAAGVKPSYLIGLIFCGLAGVIATIALSYKGIVPILKEYQVQRFLVFLDPYRTSTGKAGTSSSP